MSNMRCLLVIIILFAQHLEIALSGALADPPAGKPRIDKGDVAPAVVAMIANGDAIIEKPWDGKYVLLHFWSLNDAARDQQFEQLKQIRKEFADDDRLRMISICVDAEEWESWIRFQKRQGEVDYGDRRGRFDFYMDHQWWQTCQVSSEVRHSDDYGVENKGELFLVSPHGRLLDVRISLKEVRKSILNALKGGK